MKISPSIRPTAFNFILSGAGTTTLIRIKLKEVASNSEQSNYQDKEAFNFIYGPSEFNLISDQKKKKCNFIAVVKKWRGHNLTIIGVRR